MRRRNSRNQCGLARVREADQANVRQQLQFKLQVALLSGLSFFRFARRLMPGLGEMLIAAPAFAALREHDSLARLGEVASRSPVSRR